MGKELEGAPETIWMQPATKDKLCFISYLDKPDPVGPFVSYTLKATSDARIAEVEAANEKLFALNEGLIAQLHIEQTEARNEALEEAAVAGSIACYVTRHGKLGDAVLNRIRSLKTEQGRG